ncbi:thioredoxin family protein [Salibacterium aidingense]|uniref:thioredoxin family protein n=1 Tax=Salibacterium aidingense TaxID=384933 RepID=UPI003BD17C91
MKEITAEDVEGLKHREEPEAVFFYTPLCGTCKWAGRMMEHLEKIYGDSSFFQADINQMPAIAREERIKSVPCLKVYQQGASILTIYAFESVPSLLKRLHGLFPFSME